MLSGNPLEFVGVMDLIQPLKTKEIESKLKVNWKKNMQNWSRFECGGARFFFMTYVSQVQEFMGTCLSKVRVLKKKQTDQHIYLIPPNSTYQDCKSRKETH